MSLEDAINNLASAINNLAAKRDAVVGEAPPARRRAAPSPAAPSAPAPSAPAASSNGAAGGTSSGSAGKASPPSELVQIRDLLLGTPGHEVDELLAKYVPAGTRPSLGAVHSKDWPALLADAQRLKNGGNDLDLDSNGPAEDPLAI